jgi:hypothetical protein
MRTIIAGMNKPSRIKRCEKEIEVIGQELLRLGPMHPGSISQQYHVCGTPTCRCHHPTEPKKHGPYNKLTYVHRGRPVCRFVREIDANELCARLKAYKTFRTLTDKWIALSIERGMIEFFPSSDKPRRKSSPRAK